MKRLVLLALPIVLAACGQTNPALIPQSNAQALSSTADRVAEACAKGDRTEARSAVRDARQQIDALPRKVSSRLKDNLNEWVDQISGRISDDCQGEATPTPTDSPTEAPTETATATPTATPTATATPTQSAYADRHPGADRDRDTEPGRRCSCSYSHRRPMTTDQLFADRYRLERRLGVGGMATVQLAFDTRLERYVAVKLLAEHLAEDSSFVSRFRREALAAARLVHPNIVQVFDFGSENSTGRNFIVMEYVDGQSCAEILRDRGPLTPRDAVDILGQACRGLDYAHRNGVVHRDVKPGNLLRNTDGVVKLADFGIAKATEQSDITKAGSVLGTAAYLSPEQTRGEPAEPGSDLYALGVVAYQLLSGRLPYEAASLTDLARLQETAAPPALDELNRDVPPALAEAVARALARERAYRFADAAEMEDALRDGLRGVSHGGAGHRRDAHALRHRGDADARGDAHHDPAADALDAAAAADRRGAAAHAASLPPRRTAAAQEQRRGTLGRAAARDPRRGRRRDRLPGARQLRPEDRADQARGQRAGRPGRAGLQGPDRPEHAVTTRTVVGSA